MPLNIKAQPGRTLRAEWFTTVKLDIDQVDATRRACYESLDIIIAQF